MRRAWIAVSVRFFVVVIVVPNGFYNIIFWRVCPGLCFFVKYGQQSGCRLIQLLIHLSLILEVFFLYILVYFYDFKNKPTNTELSKIEKASYDSSPQK